MSQRKCNKNGGSGGTGQSGLQNRPPFGMSGPPCPYLISDQPYPDWIQRLSINGLWGLARHIKQGLIPNLLEIKPLFKAPSNLTCTFFIPTILFERCFTPSLKTCCVPSFQQGLLVSQKSGASFMLSGGFNGVFRFQMHFLTISKLSFKLSDPLSTPQNAKSGLRQGFQTSI